MYLDFGVQDTHQDTFLLISVQKRVKLAPSTVLAFRISVQERVKLTVSTVLAFRLVDNCDVCQHLAMCFSTVSRVLGFINMITWVEKDSWSRGDGVGKVGTVGIKCSPCKVGTLCLTF